MISVAIAYKPALMPFAIKKNVQIPVTWDECTDRQVKALLYSQTEEAKDVRFISAFTGLSLFFVSKLDKFLQYQLIEQIAEVSKSNFSGKFYIAKIKCGKETLCAPGQSMRGVTFGQFIFVDAYFNDKNPESILKFIAHLYLPEGENFNEDRCLARVANINADEATIEAILYNYSLFYEYFQRAYPLLFHSSVNSVDSVNSESNYDPRGWLKVYESVVGKDIVNSDRYADVPLNQMFRFLTEQSKQQARESRKN
jgi:hypothetical protein